MKQFPFVTAIVLLACLVFVNAQAQSNDVSKVLKYYPFRTWSWCTEHGRMVQAGAR